MASSRLIRRSRPIAGSSALRLALGVLAILLGLGRAEAQVVTGVYYGDGTTQRRITGLGFQPIAVIIKADASQITVMRTATMVGDATKPLINGTALTANMIKSLDPDGFTVGSDNTVNGLVSTRYFWTAFAPNPNMVAGTYTGTAPLTQAYTGVGFQPTWVTILSSSTRWALHRTSAGGNLAFRYNGNPFGINDAITSLDPTGFTVSRSGTTSNSMNVNGEVYHYLAVRSAAGQIAVGNYSGDLNPDRQITGLGFRPAYVIDGSITAALSPHQRSDKMPGDYSFNFQSSAAQNMIENILPNGFQVGNDDDVNGNTTPNCSAALPCTYAWVAFAGPQVNYRSIGTNAANLYASGTATLPLGSSTVTFTGCLPASVGIGDALTFTSGSAETLYVLSRDSSTQLTLQTAAAFNHAAGSTFTVKRAYNTLAAWETGQGGNLVTGNRQEVGVAWNDSTFTAGVTIGGNTVDATHYMKLTVAPFQRHLGTAGGGVILDGANASTNGITVNDNFTVVEGFELIRHRGANGAAAISVGGTGVLLQDLLVHDFDDATFTVVGIKANANSSFTVRNSIFYDGGGPTGQPAAIRGTNAPNTVAVQNCTVYKLTGRGIFADAGTFTVTNTLAVDNTIQDFDIAAGTQSYNVSSDASATGTGSLTGRSATTQFVSTIVGREDLHLQTGSDALDVGTDLSLSFSNDIDGSLRPGTSAGWDVGADEKPTINYRSIGMNTGTVYGVGTGSATAGSTVVTFAGGASLPVNVGLGDMLTFNGFPAEQLFILQRDSATQVTLQAPAPTTRTALGYTIVRAFSGAAGPQNWQTARQGNLTAANRAEVGVLYNDAAFVYNSGGPPSTGSVVVIQGSITDSQCNMKLTVPVSQRHPGVAGTGVVFDGTGNTKFGVQAMDNYTVVEWIEFTGFHGTGLAGAVAALSGGRAVLFNGLIIHNFFDPGGNAATGMRVYVNGLLPGLSFTARNCIVYDGEQTGIRNDNCDSHVIVQNSTVFNMHGNTPRGVAIGSSGGTMSVTNTISMNNSGGPDFVTSGGTLTQSNNISADTTAAGAGSLTLQNAATIFVNTTSGTENFHLKAGAAAIDAGTNLAATGFANDIDFQVRPSGAAWDIGADEFGGTTAVTLLSFEASPADGAVELSWTTASELQNLGFHLYRSDSAAGPFERITSLLIAGLGSSPVGRSYSYRDSGLVNGRTYHYLLEDVETTGRAERHGPVSATPQQAPSAAPSPATGSPSETSYGDPTVVGLRELERSASHVVLELTTGGFLAAAAEDGRVRLRIPGFASTSRPGEPSLLARRAFVEAVAGRQVRLANVQAFDEVSFRGLRPVAQGTPEIETSDDGTVAPSERAAHEGRAFRERFPAEAAALVGASFQEDRKKAEVVFSPLRWDGSGLVLSRRVVVRLEFTGREPRETSRGGSSGRLRVERGSLSSGVLAQLVARNRGLYRVAYEEIFGVDAGRERRRIPVSGLRLSRLGVSVAFHVEPESATFGPGSWLYFLSEGSALNPYGDAVYELALGTDGIRMGLESLSPVPGAATRYLQDVVREENVYYQAGLLDAPDLWLWDVVVSPGTGTYDFAVDKLVPGYAGRLSVDLQGASDFDGVEDHHVRVRVNGTLVGETQFDGKKPTSLDLAIGPGVLLEGANVLSLDNVGDTGAAYSMVFLDRFRVSYPRRLEATAGTLEGGFEQTGTAMVAGLGSPAVVLDTAGRAPRWLTGAAATPAGLSLPVQAGRNYFLTSSFQHPEVRPTRGSTLRSPTNRADYLLIAPEVFLAAAQPLLALRQSQGLVTKAVALEDVYAQFGHGEAGPDGIKAFLENSYHSWAEPSFRYVVLLGDASYDPKDYLGTGVKDWLPGFPVRTSYLWTVSDPSYASVNGEDLIPDIAIGRLPAGSVDEAQRLVQKVLNYENGGGRLDGPAVLVADNADLGGDFEADAEEIATGILAGRNPTRIYYSQQGASTRQKIEQAFDDGASIMSYVGHGATAVWASENIFNRSDVNDLTPQSQQPFLLTMNCLNGFFQFPPLDSLSEALLKAEGKGAVAAFSPSGLSVNEAAHVYHKVVLEEIVSGRHGRIGDALLAAQERYAQTGSLPELLSVYHLLGDPALSIR